ncbi:MAG: c-type cytochrome [Solidesulfovibrio sp.]
MRRLSVYLALVATALLLAFGAWIVFFFQATTATKRIPSTATAAAPQSNVALARVTFNPPNLEDAPENIREAVLLGYKIMTETKKYAGKYVGNDLACTNCHFDGGRSMKTISLVGVGATYPQYQSRTDYATDLTVRSQGCFERSMNGSAPAWNSQIMQSLLVYFQWISKDIPVYSRLPWRLPQDLGNDHKPDIATGEAVYRDVCARCHGENGNGTPIAPPVWGEGAYNDGAGMHRIRTFAVFAWKFMPKNAPVLTQEQALDVAAFAHDKPRPKFVGTHPDKVEREIALPSGK